METVSNYRFRYKNLYFWGDRHNSPSPSHHCRFSLSWRCAVMVCHMSLLKSELKLRLHCRWCLKNQCDFLVVSWWFSFEIKTVQSCSNQLRTGSQNFRNLRTENWTDDWSGQTEPDLNWTVGLVRLVLVLCISSELNFGNTTTRRLRENDLYLKPQKCEFGVTKVNFLGFIIEHGKMTMDPVKLAGIADWPAPSTLWQLWSFLGFGNFYLKFIHHYSELTHPLNGLLQKDQWYDWTANWQLAFDKLKQWFMEEPVLLLLPDQTRPFQIKSDASKYASGAVLMQTDINGDWHPCAYMSKSFSPAKQNYEVYDRELLAIIRALQDWRHYVQGSPHETIVYSDYKNLTYFWNPQKLNRQQAGWSLELSEYDLKLVHLPGTKMVQSDALSRRSNFYLDEDNNNEDVTLLPENLFVNLINLNLQRRIAASDLYDWW